MADVSGRLRAARERAGLAIQDISARTKLKIPQLEAIERGQFERLPGEFFTRAFLRTYAREVGLPPDEIVREYDAGRAVSERGDGSSAVTVATAAPVTTLSGPRSDFAASLSSPDVPSAVSLRRAWPAVAFAVLLLVALAILNRPSDRAAEAGAVSTTGTSSAPSAPAATSGPAQRQPERLTMDIEPAAEIWISATADGKRAVYRLVRPGERIKVEARNEMSFRVGNAGAFQYSINGVQGRVLGQPGEVLEFQVTRDNVRTYQR